MNREEQLLMLCQRLKPLVGRKADALWLGYVTADTLPSKLQAEAFIWMFAAKHLPLLPEDETIFLPPPSTKALSGEFYLGEIRYASESSGQLFLDRENFMKHIGIFSITGGGKTNICMSLLLKLQEAHIPFMVIDWKRSYRHLRNVSDSSASIRVFSVGRDSDTPFAWNPLRGPPGVHYQTWLAVVAETLEKSHVSGQGVADIFMEIFDQEFTARGFAAGGSEGYPTFFDALDRLSRQSLKGRRQLWQDSCLRILRTFTFGPAAQSFNSRDPLAFEELLDSPTVLELDQELPKPLRVFFSELALRWIHLYRLGQGEVSRLRHVLVIEEVHNLFPKTQIERQSVNSLETVVREIRSFGQGLVFITQHPSLLPIYILGNCNTQIYLPLQHEDDVRIARKALFLPEAEAAFLDRLNVGEGIVKIKGRLSPCHVRFPLVRLPDSIHPEDAQ